MSLVATDWTVDRTAGDIRYTGDDHGGASPSDATVIQFHRWLQDLADDAVASGDDELDITNQNPSSRSTDNIVTLLSTYNIDNTAAEHLYDGSIIQESGATIFDGIVNFGNANVQIQVHQNGAVLSDDWWNYDGGGLNSDATQGISHRFMLKARTEGADIDNRKVIGTSRTFGNTYAEFKISATSRGNNVLALTDSDDLNNETASVTVSGWSTIINLTPGYVGLDVDSNAASEYYYSEWDMGSQAVNDLYEYGKWLTMDGTATNLYGISGELFRGITHEIQYDTLSGTFDEGYAISWTGTNSGTGQVLADNGTDKVWIQLLTGVAPTVNDNLDQSSPDSCTASVAALVDRESLITTPFIGASTGAAIIGGYGVGVQATDLTSADKLFDLDNAQVTPPNNVTNTVAGLVVGEDRVLVAPWDGVSYDDESNPAIDKDLLSLNENITWDNVASIITTESIPSDTPSAGVVRVTDNDGFERRLEYSSYAASKFVITTTDGNEDFAAVNANVGNDVYVAYLDKLAASSNESYTGVYSTPRNLMVLVRDGAGTPIKEFISEWSFSSANQTITAIRTTDA